MNIARSADSFTELRITLVHGTWAHGFFRRSPSDKSGSWFSPGSSFRNELSSELALAGIKSHVSSFNWSGANTVAARARAANRLTEALREALSKDSSPHLVVAHSHGGNVALHAIAGLEKEHKPLALLTLATPFIATTRRSHSQIERKSIDALKYTLLSIPCFLLAFLCVFVFHIVLDNLFGLNIVDIKHWSGGFLFALLYMIPLLAIFGFSIDSLDSKIKKFYSNKKREVIVLSKADSFPPSKLICLRAPRDEASVVLSAAVLADSACAALRGLVNLPVSLAVKIVGRRRLAKWRLIKRRLRNFARRRGGLLEFLHEGAKFYLVLALAGAYGSAVFLSLLAIFANQNIEIGNINDIPLRLAVLLPFALIVTWVFALTIVLVILSILLMSVVVVFYGWEYCITIWQVHVYAEAQPLGIPCRTTMIASANGSSLRHSIYESKESVQFIVNETLMLANMT